MFDDLRQQSDETSFNETTNEAGATVISTPPPPKRFLGMTGPQRLLIALMLLFMVCLLG